LSLSGVGTGVTSDKVGAVVSENITNCVKAVFRFPTASVNLFAETLILTIEDDGVITAVYVVPEPEKESRLPPLTTTWEDTKSVVTSLVVKVAVIAEALVVVGGLVLLMVEESSLLVTTTEIVGPVLSTLNVAPEVGVVVTLLPGTSVPSVIVTVPDPVSFGTL
jgi:hypothetical protein